LICLKAQPLHRPQTAFDFLKEAQSMQTELADLGGAFPPWPVRGISPRSIASYEQELAVRRATEAHLRDVLARGEALLRLKTEAIEYQALMRKESDHRLLNDMQIVVGLLALQGRASGDAQISSQLLVAANRVNMIARIHQRLHGLDGMQTVAFQKYLKEFCSEFSQMLSSHEMAERVVVAEAGEIELPAATAIPLAFIVSELLTNAVKYGKGQIDVRLQVAADKSCLLSVSNGGPALPDGFDPAACKGLGMKIIQSFAQKIGGKLRFGPGEAGQGVNVTVAFG
jgi:two-component sensor histidine kinase